MGWFSLKLWEVLKLRHKRCFSFSPLGKATIAWPDISTLKSTLVLDSSVLKTILSREGGTHILRHRGMLRKNGSAFYKKSLDMGLIFHLKIPSKGSVFQNFLGFAQRTLKILKNRCAFVAKCLEMGTYFWKNPYNLVPIFGKITHRYGYGCCVSGGTPPTKPNLSTPPSFQSIPKMIQINPDWPVY